MNNAIYKKLAAVQGSLFVPKGQTNKFGGYNYRSCEDILKAVKPLLAANGLALWMSSRTETVGASTYVSVTATVADAETGETVQADAQAREPESRKGMDAAQVSGSSLSYARKYALAGLFGIDNERDPDATNDHADAEQKPATPAPKKPSETAPRATPAWDVCPCGKTKGTRWTDIPTETLEMILGFPPDKVPQIKDEHRARIRAELAKRVEKKIQDI